MQAKVTETREKEETKREKEKRREKDEQKHSQGGCLSWMRKRQREKHKPRKKNIFTTTIHLKGW